MALTDEELDLTFAALADGTRRAILARLSVGEATVNELAEPFSISLQAVSKHLKVLERAGLITRSRDAQWRPCRLQVCTFTCQAFSGKLEDRQRAKDECLKQSSSQRGEC